MADNQETVRLVRDTACDFGVHIIVSDDPTFDLAMCGAVPASGEDWKDIEANMSITWGDLCSGCFENVAYYKQSERARSAR